MPSFDAYSLMDFSARSSPSPVKPTADACWLGTATRGGRVRAEYFRTRSEAMARWSAWVEQQVQQHRRVLAGFDFAFGYPQGFTEARTSSRSRKPWRTTWTTLATEIEDDDTNRNNRFEVASQLNESIGTDRLGPFWGGPPTMLANYRALHPKRRFDWPYDTKRNTALPRLRLTDQLAPNAQEAWKLAGIGSVGSQSLLGIAALGRLLGFGKSSAASWATHAQIWPFQHGFTPPSSPADQPAVTLVEAFPSLLGDRVDARMNPHDNIRDAAQVDAWCRWARDQDRRGRLTKHFATPAQLTAEQAAACVAEEGWIFGVT
ncbi:MAG: hypothetical protein AAGF84_09615 [Planctomycetota bacterium]